MLAAEAAGPEGAPVVVLVHGSMDRAAGLLKLSRRLDADHRVVRYDRRGYGRSAPHDGPFGVEAQVADALEVIERCAPERPVTVFGHSYGGNVALALAERLGRDRVPAVAVYETPLSWLDWWPGTTAGAAAWTDDDPERAAERFMRRLVGDERWSRLPERTRAARRREGLALIGELRDLATHAPWDAEAIEVPVIAMRGSRGVEHHRRSTEHLGEVLRDCRVVDIDGARHFGPNTHPDAVAQVIGDLVARTVAA